MKKMPHVFVDSRGEMWPGMEWVFDAEVSEKYDGRCAMLGVGGGVWLRHVLKFDHREGRWRNPPEGWVQADGVEESAARVAGGLPGWVAAPAGDPVVVEACRSLEHFRARLTPGTYEMVGPKIAGNPYRLPVHDLWPHGEAIEGLDDDGAALLDGLREAQATRDPGYFRAACRALIAHAGIEGLVFRSADGRMAKVKATEYGIDWRRGVPGIMARRRRGVGGPV